MWYSVHITPPCPRLFLSAETRFLEKGEKSISCVEWFYKKAVWDVVKSWEFEENLRCIKILRIRRKTPMKWIVSISRDYWVYLTLLWKISKISEFWGEFWGIENFSRSKFSLATGVTQNPDWVCSFGIFQTILWGQSVVNREFGTEWGRN